jgi:hypothetical protein
MKLAACSSLDGAFLFGFGAASTDVDAGIAAVGREVDLVDDHGDFEARVLEFAGQHGVDFVSDLFADAFTTVIDSGHGIRQFRENLLYSNGTTSSSDGVRGRYECDGANVRWRPEGRCYNGKPSENIYRVIDQDRAEDALSFGQDVLQRYFDVLFGVGHRDNADGGALPDVVKVEFGYGNVELAAQAILEAAQNLTLVL